MNELRDWLKSKPHYNAERQTSGNLIMDPEIIQKLENTIDIYQSKESPIKPVVMMKVKLQFIYMVKIQLFVHELTRKCSAVYNTKTN